MGEAQLLQQPLQMPAHRVSQPTPARTSTMPYLFNISHALLVSSSCTRQAAGTGVWVSSQDVRAHLGHVMKDKRTICLMDKMLGNALLAGFAVHQ